MLIIQFKCLTSVSDLKENSNEKITFINNKIDTINELCENNQLENIKLKYYIEDVLDEIDPNTNKELVFNLINLLNTINNSMGSKIISYNKNENIYYNSYNTKSINIINNNISTINNTYCDFSQSFSPNLGLNR